MTKDEEEKEKINRDIEEEEDLDGEMVFNMETGDFDNERRHGLETDEIIEKIEEKIQENSEDDSD